jgi:uncharacterized protein (TIGR02147 family)
MKKPLEFHTHEANEFVRRLFLERRERNGAYSTRAFARDLGMSQALVSLIMSGKRSVTAKQAMRISLLLKLPEETSQKLLKSISIGNTSSKSINRITKERFESENLNKFKLLAQWYHLAILDLTTTTGFKNHPTWIAKRLGISPIEAQDGLSRLISLGLLKKTNKSLKKTNAKISFASKQSEASIRMFHKQMIEKAKIELDRVDAESFKKREVSSVTVAVRSDRIAEAKRRIFKFQNSIANFLSQGPCDEVFQFNVQLFPLSRGIKNLKESP